MVTTVAMDPVIMRLYRDGDDVTDVELPIRAKQIPAIDMSPY